MRIIETQKNEPVIFTESDLPMLIHGAQGTGASFFSIVLFVDFIKRGYKILFFTAYPMAKEALFEQLVGSGVEPFIIDGLEKLDGAEVKQVLVIQSGNRELCEAALLRLKDIEERVILIKNCDTELDQELFTLIQSSSRVVLSGDVDVSEMRNKILSWPHQSSLLFSALKEYDDGVYFATPPDRRAWWKEKGVFLGLEEVQ